MSNRMSQREFSESLDKRLSGLQEVPWLEAKVLAKAEGEKTHTNIKIANIENNLKKKYESDLGALEKLITFINNDFYEVNNSEFSIFSQVIMKVKNNKRLIMIPIDESLEPLANAFIYAIYAGNLWIHTCHHCGNLFLSNNE